MLYTSKEYLHATMDVNPEIAAFFVDRKVPANNLYWKDRYLYVSKGKGFLFIPLFFDLMYRAGLGKELILQEEFVQLTEAILHSAALQEAELILQEEHVDNCKRLVAGKVVIPDLYTDLLQYFGQHALPYNYLGTFSKALNRADTYLFALCSICMPPALTGKIVELWSALVPSFLLMDDVMDLKEDLAKGEENSINDFGSGKTGLRNAIQFLTDKIATLREINPKLGDWFGRLLEKVKMPYMILLNE